MGNGNVFSQVLGNLEDAFTHPFPTSKPHTPTDAIIQQAAHGGSTKLSALVGKFTDWDVRTATAIALAESRGRVNARSPTNTDGSKDHGLFQVNDKAHPNYDIHLLESDPEYNVSAAHDIWKAAGGFTPWTTYKSGAYKSFLGHDATIKLNPLAGTNYENSPVPAIVNAGDSALGAIGDVVTALADPSTYARLGKGALGGILLIIGVGGVVFVVANRIPAPVKKAAAVAAL